MKDSFKLPVKPTGIPWAVPGRKIDFRTSFGAHYRLASWVGGGVVAMGLLVALIAGHPRDVAESAVRVAPNFPKTLQEDVEPRFNSNSDYRDYVQQQVVEIESPQTTANGLKLLGARRTLWQRPGESDYHAAERLMWALKVQPVAGTYLITVGLEAQRPDGLAEIVNAVVAAYLARQQSQEANGSDLRVQLLVSRHAQLGAQIEALRKQESQLAGELGVSTFAPGFASPYDKMVGDASAALYVAGRNLIEVRARLTALQDHQQRVEQLEVDSTAQQMLASDHDATGANAQLMAQREAAVIELQGLGPNHPGRKALELQIRNIDDAIAQTRATAMRSLRSMLLQNRDTKQRQEISEAQAHVDEAQLATTGIEDEVVKLRASTAAFGAKYNLALSNRDEIDRLQKNSQAIDDRIDFLRLEAPAPGFVRVESLAQTPDLAVKGGRRKIFALFLFAALVLALVVPAGVDLIDPRVKTLDELEAILSFAPLGAVIGTEAAVNQATDDSCAAGANGLANTAPYRGDNARSDRLAHESMRRIAFAIIREWRLSGVRTFALVPVSAHTGTTALALALVRELNGLGRSAVAIEANQFSPDLRYQSARGTSLALANGHANGGNSDGRVEGGLDVNGGNGKNGNVLVGHSAASALEQKLHSIVDADGMLPERIPICRHLEGPPRLTLECIESLVVLALATNDLVILDAPALMNSGDAEMLIQLPAAAILVVRECHDVVTEVMAAARVLERLAPPVVGAILNGITVAEGVSREPPIAIGLALASAVPPATFEKSWRT